MADDQAPATSIILAGEAWLAKTDADLEAAETRLHSKLAARRNIRSRLEKLERLSCSLASDAAMLIAFAATRNLVTGSANVDMADCNKTGDGARSAYVDIADCGETGDGARSADVDITDCGETGDDRVRCKLLKLLPRRCSVLPAAALLFLFRSSALHILLSPLTSPVFPTDRAMPALGPPCPPN
jgi:hypothetical protein